MTIGDKIREIRKKKNLTQEQLALLMGYANRSVINKIESGINSVTYETLVKLSKVLEVDINELIPEEKFQLLDIYEIIENAKRANMTDDLSLSVYKVPKEQFYNLAIISPTWNPEKIFKKENIITLHIGSTRATYEIIFDDFRLLFIKCGTGSNNVLDAMLALSENNIRNFLFIGAVGALNSDVRIGDFITPNSCHSYDGALPYLYKRIDRVKYGEVISPKNANFINELLKELEKENLVITKKNVFCTNSIMCEYSHLDYILSLGCDMIEMETAAFTAISNLLDKNSIAIMCVSDNSMSNKSLFNKTLFDKQHYDYNIEYTYPKIINKILSCDFNKKEENNNE